MGVLKGHDFCRAANGPQSRWTLAPEGRNRSGGSRGLQAPESSGPMGAFRPRPYFPRPARSRSPGSGAVSGIPVIRYQSTAQSTSLPLCRLQSSNLFSVSASAILYPIDGLKTRLPGHTRLFDLEARFLPCDRTTYCVPADALPDFAIGRNRRADQTSSIATIATARQPRSLNIARILSRDRSPASLEPIFGYVIQTKVFSPASFRNFGVCKLKSAAEVANNCTNVNGPSFADAIRAPSGRGANDLWYRSGAAAISIRICGLIPSFLARGLMLISASPCLKGQIGFRLGLAQ